MSDASAVESLLFAALDKPTAAERNAFLDSACAGDADLRRQVEKLLKAHANVGAFLQKPVVEQLAVTPEAADATQQIAGSTDGPDAVRPGGTGVRLERTEGGAARDRGGSLDFLQPATRPGSLGRLGHYEVLEVLGQGGFGIVFRAFDEQLQRVVAIKVLSAEMSATTAARKRFLREARSSAKVRHDNAVEVYAVEEQPLPYLVMEFVPGETLQQRSDRTGPMEVTDVVRIGRQIAEGLAAAHAQGLIHRDIKPGNILIEAGPNQQVKITDFGLARAADDASLSQSGTIAGTPMYMSPEQASADTLDHRADLFSLGSVLYAMCTGHPPFRAPNTLAVLKRVVEDTPRPIREIIPETPAWLCDLIAKLHAKKPGDRFATGREVADLLGRGLAALQSGGLVKLPSIAAPAVRKTPPSQETPEAAPTIKPRFRLRRWLVAAAVLLTLLGGFTVTEATGVTKMCSTVIRLFSPEGTLVVEVDDPEVSVQIDGSDIVIRGAGVKEIRLKPGSYTVKGIKDGQVVSRELVTVAKNGKQIVRVSQEARPAELPPTFKNSIGMEFVLVPKGKSWLGGGKGKPGDKEVEIPADFYLGKYEVTQEEWEKVMHTNPSAFSRTGPLGAKVADIDEMELKHFPVEEVSRAACQEFVKRLTALESQHGWKYRLPTEVEWEYACRGGPMVDKAQSAFAFYLEKASNALMPGQTNFNQSGLGRTCKVGSYAPNRLGLHDMHGNVWEWCFDGEKEGDEPSVIRGGSWTNNSEDCQAVHRVVPSLIYKPVNRGLRLARVPSSTPSPGTKGPDVKTNLDPDRRAAEYVLSISGIVKVNGENQEIRAAADLPAESFQLTWVELARNKQLTDARLADFTKCKNLIYLSLWQTNVGDEGLVHVKECKAVTRLWLGSTRVTDAGLAHLEGRTNLVFVDLKGTRVTDVGVAYLKECRGLDYLGLSGTGTTDAGLAHLTNCRDLRSLFLNNTQVTAKGVEGLAKALPWCKITWDGSVSEPKVVSTPFTDADVQRIAALPAAEQVKEIRAELMRRNPEFRGTLIPTIKDGVVTGLKSQDVKRSIADLSPLRGMKLTELHLINHSQVADLTPLRGMPLERLSLWPFLGSDLTPLQGMPLKFLNIGGGGQKLDLTPLAGMPLEILCINVSQVSDLTPLKGMPLKNLACSNTLVADLDPLRGMPLNFLHITNCKVSDLAPIQGMPLGRMDIDGTSVTDLSPLKGMPLKDIRLTPKNITQGLDILRDMKSLKTIGANYDKAWPAAEFWARYDKGEFKK